MLNDWSQSNIFPLVRPKNFCHLNSTMQPVLIPGGGGGGGVCVCVCGGGGGGFSDSFTHK